MADLGETRPLRMDAIKRRSSSHPLTMAGSETLVTGQALMPERADTQKWGELVEKYRLIGGLLVFSAISDGTQS